MREVEGREEEKRTKSPYLHIAVQPVLIAPLMQDPLIDGLSFFPCLVVKQRLNTFWEYLCNC